jgi:polyhydroxyalkanoate synthesis regulator phasin
LEQIRLKEALACLRHGRRMGLGRLLGNANHLSHLVEELVEQPASEWQDRTVQELLEQARESRKPQ